MVRMTTHDQHGWNERYLKGEFGYRDPDAFVMDAHRNYLMPLLAKGGAGLDLAGGAGHHAIWLAQQGWQMTLADFSDAALAMAKQHADAASITLEVVSGAAQHVVQSLVQQNRTFSFVLVSFFLERALLPLLPLLLQPKGLLLYRTYTVDNVLLGNPRGPHNPEYLAQPQELLKTYSAMRILHYNETVAVKGVAELIAQSNES